jgi:hypothetical protein
VRARVWAEKGGGWVGVCLLQGGRGDDEDEEREGGEEGSKGEHFARGDFADSTVGNAR